MTFEIQNKIKNVREALLMLKNNVSWESLKKDYSDLKKKTEEDNFWKNKSFAQDIMKQIKINENRINMIDSLSLEILEIEQFLDMAIIENDSKFLKELDEQLNILIERCEKKKIETLFNDKHDFCDCFIEIHAGAGGTEAQDWAMMLQRMYMRWAERKGFKVGIIEESFGDEAGIKSSTLKLKGNYAFGWSRTETGVHRLVRISPFDSSSRRHTSFASVWVFPDAENNIDIVIDDKDLKIDTYRASGAGGQHVNKTDSAIRITHLPSKTVVQCQNDRSQHRNRAQAMNMLKAKLYEIELKKQEKENEKLASTKEEIGWGSQIRSYVLHPYNLVKDLRTNIETGNTNSVLDGKIDLFINKALSARL